MNKKIIAIILGNRLKDDGTITTTQEERLLMALEIQEKFNPDYFILSGGSPNTKANKSEAEAMYDYLIEKGMDKNKLIKEDKSLSTVQNAKFSVPLAFELGAEIIIVCSSLYHFEDPQYSLMPSFIKEAKQLGLTMMTYFK